MDSVHLQTISEQNKKIKIYELKLRDLIEAYKGVVKEKETLEKAVESFSRPKVVRGADNVGEVHTTQDQLDILSNSLASLTEEKRRMERSFLEDKRVMRMEYENKIKAERSELETQFIIVEKLRKKLEVNESIISKMEEKANDQEYQLNAVNEECGRMKLSFSLMEHERVTERSVYEGRVAKLEEVIADISKNIAHMEKQHLSDSENIWKLSDRIQTLVSESRSSTKPREQQSDTPDILQFQDFDKGDINSAKTTIDRVARLMDHLDVDLEFVKGISTLSGSCGGNCEDTIRQLKDQLECTELKLESVTRTKSLAAYSSYQPEMDRINEELLLAKAKVTDLQEELSNLDSIASKKERGLKDSIMKLERLNKQEIIRLQQEHIQAISDLQSELTNHRNRTINLLSEKEIEIQSLQRIVQTKCSQSFNEQLEPPLDLYKDNSDIPISSKFDSSCPLYQCCEIKARMDQELRRLRQQKRQLEMNVHKLEADNEYSRSDMNKEIETLTERLKAAESLSNLSSTINMEYLRNVFVRFLTTSDSSCKYLMARAIGKVLQINPKDLKCLEKSSSVTI